MSSAGVTALARYADGQGSVSGANLNTFEQTCDTVVQLRAFIGLPNIQVYSRGIAAPNDGGAGSFWWDQFATAPDDNLNVIVPAGVATGAWVRISEGSAAGNVLSGLYVNSSRYPTLAAADAAAVSLGYGLNIDANWTLTIDTGLSAKQVIFSGGAITRGVFALSGNMWAQPDQTIFDVAGTGVVTFTKSPEIYLQWFGITINSQNSLVQTNNTTACNAAVKSMFASNAALVLPNGIVFVNSSVSLDYCSTLTGGAGAYSCFIRGASCVNTFAQGFAKGSQLWCTNNNSPLIYTDPGATGQGPTFGLRDFCVINSGATTVWGVDIAVFGQNSIMSNVNVLQAGNSTGGGVILRYATCSLIERCTILGPGSGGGTQYGTGLTIENAANASGLVTVTKVTSRGFLRRSSYGEGAAINISLHEIDGETSACADGWILGSSLIRCTIDNAYHEGVSGTVFTDNGIASIIRGSYGNSSFAVGISSPGSTEEGAYLDNFLEANVNGATCLAITDGGTGKIVSGNNFSTSLPTGTGMTGIAISGSGPKVTGLSSNIFGVWSSAGGSVPISGNTASVTPGCGTGTITSTNTSAAFNHNLNATPVTWSASITNATTNAVYIKEITCSATQITVTLSGDPGASGANIVFRTSV